MITRYDCMMDGVALSSVAPSIYVLDIQESAPRYVEELSARPIRPGQRVLRRVRESLAVTVTIAIREYDVTRRKNVCSHIAAWAQGKYLSINDRPDQRLLVVCSTPPTVASALKWTESIRMTFTAYEIPFWEEVYPVRTATTTGSATLRPVGTVEAVPLLAEITAQSAIDTLSISVNGGSYAFSGLGMAAGDVLTIGYEDGVQVMRVGAESALSKRTPESSDDLYVRCGEANKITITADGSYSAVFSARGCWE